MVMNFQVPGSCMLSRISFAVTTMYLVGCAVSMSNSRDPLATLSAR